MIISKGALVEFVVAALEPLIVTDHLIAVLVTVGHLSSETLSQA